eukprot:m.182393 g.182393  ORF g.182393 m.182393 type:complete len:533 (+) comp14668_c0_seq4:339-1937(+)
MASSQHHVQHHYDRHGKSSQQESRAQADMGALRAFHNAIKRSMLEAARRRDITLVDWACGRLGDAWKWQQCGYLDVTAIDISPASIEQAQRRVDDVLEAHRSGRIRGPPMQVKLQVGDCSAPVPLQRKYTHASCMFAAHYMFETKERACQFFENVSASLQVGGCFFGTMPIAERINQLLPPQNQATFRSSSLHLKRLHDGTGSDVEGESGFGSFGNKIEFSIRNTVTNTSIAAEEVEGSNVEFAVSAELFSHVAERYGLVPLRSFRWPQQTGPRNPPFDPRAVLDRYPPGPRHRQQYTEAFRCFRPHYNVPRRIADELSQVSRLNAAFFFQRIMQPWEFELSEIVRLCEGMDSVLLILGNSWRSCRASMPPNVTVVWIPDGSTSDGSDIFSERIDDIGVFSRIIVSHSVGTWLETGTIDSLSAALSQLTSHLIPSGGDLHMFPLMMIPQDGTASKEDESDSLFEPAPTELLSFPIMVPPFTEIQPKLFLIAPFALESAVESAGLVIIETRPLRAHRQASRAGLTHVVTTLKH